MKENLNAKNLKVVTPNGIYEIKISTDNKVGIARNELKNILLRLEIINNLTIGAEKPKYPFLFRYLRDDEIILINNNENIKPLNTDNSNYRNKRSYKQNSNQNIEAILHDKLALYDNELRNLLNILSDFIKNFEDLQLYTPNGEYIPSRNTFVVYQAIDWAFEIIEKQRFQELKLFKNIIKEIAANTDKESKAYSSDIEQKEMNVEIKKFVQEKIDWINFRLKISKDLQTLLKKDFCPDNCTYSDWIERILKENDIIVFYNSIQNLKERYFEKNRQSKMESQNPNQNNNISYGTTDKEINLQGSKINNDSSQNISSLGEVYTRRIKNQEVSNRQTVDVMSLPGANEVFKDNMKWVAGFINFIINSAINEVIPLNSDSFSTSTFLYLNMGKFGFKTQAEFRKAWNKLARRSKVLPETLQFGYSKDINNSNDVACFEDFLRLIYEYLKELRQTTALDYYQNDTLNKFESLTLSQQRDPNTILDIIAEQNPELGNILFKLINLFTDVHSINPKSINLFETSSSKSYQVKFTFCRDMVTYIHTFGLIIRPTGISIIISINSSRSIYSKGALIAQETYKNETKTIEIDLNGKISGKKERDVGGKISYELGSEEIITYLKNKVRHLNLSKYGDGSERYSQLTFETFLKGL
jgi:hypothetical protein